MKRVVLYIMSLLLVGVVQAQRLEQPDTASMKVYFRYGYSSFDKTFEQNEIRLNTFVEKVRALKNNPDVRFERIRIRAGASPEGITHLQAPLAAKRAKRAVELLDAYGGLFDAPREVVSLGIDWEGLARLVEASDMPYRVQALDILRNTPEWVRRDGVIVDSRKRQLQMLQSGRVWHYMAEHFFAEVRRMHVELFYTVNREIPAVLPDTSESTSVDSAALAKCDTVVFVKRDTVLLVKCDTVTLVKRDTMALEPQRSARTFCMALKTNLLYDIALVPNAGVEFYVGRGWSLGANMQYGWWKNDAKHKYWRINGGEVGIRRYFGRRAAEQPLTGHHLGVYGQMVTYDIETGGRGYMGGRPGGNLFDEAHWGVGIEYGYSVALGRRLNLDFSLGLGYFGGEYYEYVPADTHYVWQATRRRDWFGPTKAEIALVWRLGAGALKEKKGKKE